MAVVSVSRWKASAAEALPLVKQAAPLLKAQGATSVWYGPCYSGPDAGRIYVAVSFTDWPSFARAQEALAANPQWQRVYAEALKVGELQDRSLIVAEEV